MQIAVSKSKFWIFWQISHLNSGDQQTQAAFDKEKVHTVYTKIIPRLE